ncbi:hypothetical protein TRIUR3_07797 [Triticum urartu]|uniref:Uncharacterized protein n=1 Tax=Triticum urartu TaxID=4572 RepID=M8A5Z6_TRIUA|nr:hypothetical protein TRIUR3_07797 [Triticum urartu]
MLVALAVPPLPWGSSLPSGLLARCVVYVQLCTVILIMQLHTSNVSVFYVLSSPAKSWRLWRWSFYVCQNIGTSGVFLHDLHECAATTSTKEGIFTTGPGCSRAHTSMARLPPIVDSLCPGKKGGTGRDQQAKA